jgi:hypothetical protein
MKALGPFDLNFRNRVVLQGKIENGEVSFDTLPSPSKNRKNKQIVAPAQTIFISYMSSVPPEKGTCPPPCFTVSRPR